MPGPSQTSNSHPTGTGVSPGSTGSVSVDPSSTTNSDPSDPTGGGPAGGGGGGGGGTAASEGTMSTATELLPSPLGLLSEFWDLLLVA